MRKNIKETLIDIIPTILDAHEVALKHAKSGEIDLVMSVFTECQEAMVKIGEVIEENEGENHKTIEFLQSYCDELYEVSLVIAENGEPNFNKLFKRIALKLKDVLYSIKNDIKVRQEIVFMPYKASMWDALESVWKVANEDPDCDAYVIPIPYYDRKPNHSFGEMHYEGEMFPDYVPITHYNAYNLEARHPDAIYIHNPYDEYNYVTSVDPRFYAKELKNYTDCLCYIPYFVVPSGVLAHHCTTAGCCYADKVFLQSEAVRDRYEDVYTRTYGNGFGDVKGKFVASGSPKFDAVANAKKEDFIIPEEWQKIIGNKKVILYNTSVGSILRGDKAYLEKLRDVLSYFKTQKDVVLWWRPHPLSGATYDSMRTALVGEYINLVEEYKNAGYGIYDDTPDLQRAIICTDAYYGDWSSLIALYQLTGKPVLMQSIVARTTDDFLDLTFEAMYDDGEYLWFAPIHFNALLKMKKSTEEVTLVGFFPREEAFAQRLFSDIARHNNKLYFAPYSAREIAVYDLETGEFSNIDFDKKYTEWENSAFSSVLVDENLIYFIPRTYKAIVVYNTKTNKTQYITGWAEAVKNSKYYDGLYAYGYFRKYELVGRKLYLPCVSTNIIVVLDLDSQKIELIQFGDFNIKFQSVCKSGEKLWLASVFGNKLCCLDLASGNIEPLEIPGVRENESNVPFVDICATDEKIILLPFTAGNILTFDTTTKKFEVVKECGEPVPKGFHIAHFSNAKKSDGFVYAVDLQNELVDVYNHNFEKVVSYSLKNNSLLREKLSDSKAQVMQNADVTRATTEFYIVRESVFTIADLINYYSKQYDDVKHQKGIEQRATIQKNMLSNASGTAGDYIHKYVKRFLKDK